VEMRPDVAPNSNAGTSTMITSCDPIIFRSTKHWTGHRSPLPLLDIDVIRLVEVLSVSRVEGSRRIPFRLLSRSRRRRAVVDTTSVESTLDSGVRGGDGLLEPRVCGRIQRRRRANGGPSPSLPSVSAASAVSALREECAWSDIEPPEGAVFADMS
jgi:hypothetical protein